MRTVRGTRQAIGTSVLRSAQRRHRACKRALALALPAGMPLRCTHASGLRYAKTRIMHSGSYLPRGMRIRRLAYECIELGFPGAGYPLGVPGRGAGGAV